MLSTVGSQGEIERGYLNQMQEQQKRAATEETSTHTAKRTCRVWDDRESILVDCRGASIGSGGTFFDDMATLPCIKSQEKVFNSVRLKMNIAPKSKHRLPIWETTKNPIQEVKSMIKISKICRHIFSIFSSIFLHTFHMDLLTKTKETDVVQKSRVGSVQILHTKAIEIQMKWCTFSEYEKKYFKDCQLLSAGKISLQLGRKYLLGHAEEDIMHVEEFARQSWSFYEAGLTPSRIQKDGKEYTFFQARTALARAISCILYSQRQLQKVYITPYIKTAVHSNST